jgi:hypothetical protein
MVTTTLVGDRRLLDQATSPGTAPEVRSDRLLCPTCHGTQLLLDDLNCFDCGGNGWVNWSQWQLMQLGARAVRRVAALQAHQRRQLDPPASAGQGADEANGPDPSDGERVGTPR